MHLISDVCIDTGLSADDIRLILMTTREDWETCEDITEAEYQLILQSTKAKLSESIEITPVENMPIEAQQKLVDSASQVLDISLMLIAAEKIAVLDAVDRAVNQVIIRNHKARNKELTQALENDWGKTKLEYLGVLESLSSQLITPDEGKEERVDVKASLAKTKAEIACILGNLAEGGTWA